MTLAAVIGFGLIIGSFLNVCIHRLPRGESVVWPASKCPRCTALLKPYDNIPVLGYLDDLIIVPLGICLVIALIPEEVMREYRAVASAAAERPAILATPVELLFHLLRPCGLPSAK